MKIGRVLIAALLFSAMAVEEASAQAVVVPTQYGRPGPVFVAPRGRVYRPLRRRRRRRILPSRAIMPVAPRVF